MDHFSPNEISEILSLAYDHGFKGFRGSCAGAAIAINRVLFKNKGKFVISVNEFLWTKIKRFVGHVVVEFEGVYWDADARPKSFGDIDDWGDLGEDLFYKEIAKEHGIRWTKKRASTTALYELESEKELPFGHAEADDLEVILTKVVKLYKKSRV